MTPDASAPYCERHDSRNCADCRDEAEEHARKCELDRIATRENLWIGYCDLCNGQHCVTIKDADAKVERRPHIHPEVRAALRERDAQVLAVAEEAWREHILDDHGKSPASAIMAALRALLEEAGKK